MASVSLVDIKKSFDRTEIITGVSIDVQDGEFLVLVGPSGCGKSTLLRLIAGLEEITDGSLSIGNRVVNAVEPRDRGVAMVFQSYALYPHMTVRENMAFGLKIQKTPADIIEKRVHDVAKMLDLEPYLERLPKQLSGGQRQRVAMGRAIVRQPDVFLFDEPLSNLDAALRTQMRVELKKLHQRLNTTMIYVTHDQIEAMTLADRIAVLRDGALQQIGSPAELFERPANRFVASFIGSPAMNFFAGHFKRDNGLFEGSGVGISCEGFSFSNEPSEIGIRPQHLEIVADEQALAPEMQCVAQATLEVVEPMGWEAYVHLTVAQKRVVVHVSGPHPVLTMPAGQIVTLATSLTHIHFFDANGDRVAPNQE